MQPKCIYCSKPIIEKNKEHLIPNFLNGTLENYLDFVCHDCNTNKFQRFEDRFKHDSIEGVFTSMIGLKTGRVIKPIEDLTKIRFHLQRNKKTFLDDAFPRINRQSGNIELLSQVHFRNKKSNKYEVIFVDDFKKREKHFLNKIKRDYKKQDIKVFPGGGLSLKEILKLYHLTPSKSVEKMGCLSKGENVSTELIFESQLNAKGKIDLRRLPAKIAFNYILFCAQKDGLLKYFSDKHSYNFKDIKDYIRLGKGNKNASIVNMQPPNKIFRSERYFKNRTSRYSPYIVTEFMLDTKDDYIKARVYLFGISQYNIVIGKNPFNLKFSNFRNSYKYNVFEKSFEKINSRNIKENNFTLNP